MAQKTQHNDLLPVPSPASGQPAAGQPAVPSPTPLQVHPIEIGKTLRIHPIEIVSDDVTDHMQPRDYAVAGGVLLVLLIAFFFAKKAYANHLALKRVSIGSANAAGWWLFIFLTGLATAAVLSVLNSAKFLTPMFMAPLLVISLVALILMFITGRRT